MAVFRIGMRVRIISCAGNDAVAHFVGREARIIGEKSFGFSSNFDVWRLDIEDLVVQKAGASEVLAPILPDGHRACDDDFKRDLDRMLERQGMPA